MYFLATNSLISCEREKCVITNPIIIICLTENIMCLDLKNKDWYCYDKCNRVREPKWMMALSHNEKAKKGKHFPCLNVKQFSNKGIHAIFAGKSLKMQFFLVVAHFRWPNAYAPPITDTGVYKVSVYLQYVHSALQTHTYTFFSTLHSTFLPRSLSLSRSVSIHSKLFQASICVCSLN